MSYWDTIIQSDTNAKLVAAFRQYYGLPANFPVNYSLSNTTGMVTRVEQEVSAGRVTMDVAAVASLPWVNAKVKAGQIMHYEIAAISAFTARHSTRASARTVTTPSTALTSSSRCGIPKSWTSKGRSWKDVVGAVANGRMIMGDAGKSETYLATYMGLRMLFGPDYFKSLAEMQPVFWSVLSRSPGNSSPGRI